MSLSKRERKQFMKAVRPLMEFLNNPKICHPHMHALVTSQNAQLVEGVVNVVGELKEENNENS